MIKSHVLYRLSYALTLAHDLSENRSLRYVNAAPGVRIMPAALCRGQGPCGQ